MFWSFFGGKVLSADAVENFISVISTYQFRYKSVVLWEKTIAWVYLQNMKKKDKTVIPACLFAPAILQIVHSA